MLVKPTPIALVLLALSRPVVDLWHFLHDGRCEPSWTLSPVVVEADETLRVAPRQATTARHFGRGGPM